MARGSDGALARLRAKRPGFAAVGGFSATVLFALYNGALGLWYASVWHGSICGYYILLSLLRGLLLRAEGKARGLGPEEAGALRRQMARVTSPLVLVMNLALIVPATLMVLDRRPIRMGMVPAIASAAYTTFKIASAAVKWKRGRGTVLERELSVLRLADALVSALVLQNTLLVAVDGGVSQRMFPVAAGSSAGILLLIAALSAVWLAALFRDTTGDA